VAIGNGVTNWDFDTTPALIKMAYQHGLMDLELKHEFDAHPECSWNDLEMEDNSLTCTKLVAKLRMNMRTLNPYDIYRKPEPAYDQMSLISKFNEIESDGLEMPIKGQGHFSNFWRQEKHGYGQ
jgi:hypothetical protein